MPLVCPCIVYVYGLRSGADFQRGNAPDVPDKYSWMCVYAGADFQRGNAPGVPAAGVRPDGDATYVGGVVQGLTCSVPL